MIIEGLIRWVLKEKKSDFTGTFVRRIFREIQHFSKTVKIIIFEKLEKCEVCLFELLQCQTKEEKYPNI